MKRGLTILIGTLLLILVAPESYGAGENTHFNPKDPRMSDIKIVNDTLDTYIVKKDRDNIEKLMAYTQDRVSKYAQLILIEFHEDLSMEKLEIMRQNSPQRWVLFQGYINKALAWFSISRKAENFLGIHLEKAIKKDLGEE